MDLKTCVQKAALDNNISGVMEMSKHCGLSYQKTSRVWEGDNRSKIADVITVLSSLGLMLKIIKEEVE